MLHNAAVLAMHRARQGFVKARTAQANQIRAGGLSAEYGIIIPQGIGHFAKRLLDILEDGQNGLPGAVRQLVHRLGDQLKELDPSGTEASPRPTSEGMAAILALRTVTN